MKTRKNENLLNKKEKTHHRQTQKQEVVYLLKMNTITNNSGVHTFCAYTDTDNYLAERSG